MDSDSSILESSCDLTQEVCGLSAASSVVGCARRSVESLSQPWSMRAHMYIAYVYCICLWEDELSDTSDCITSVACIKMCPE